MNSRKVQSNLPQPTRPIDPVPKPQPPPRQFSVLGAELLLSVPIGFVLAKLNFGTGLAWLFGGVLAGAIVHQASRLIFNISPKPNRMVRQIGMMLIGMVAGFAISHDRLATVATDLPAYVFIAVSIIIGCGIVGYIYARLSKIDLFTAMLSTAPGHMGVMASIAADYDKNAALVSLLHVTRYTAVILLIPWFAGVSAGDRANVQTAALDGNLINLNPAHLGLLLLSLLVVTVGSFLASRLKIPGAAFWAATMVAIGFNFLLGWIPLTAQVGFTLPPLINILGQLLVGIALGEFWGNKPALGRRALAYLLIASVLVVGAGLIVAGLVMPLTSWDWLTCMLVTTPGASTEIVVVALALNHDVETIAAGHLVRLVIVSCTLPLWVSLFRYLDRRLSRAN